MKILLFGTSANPPTGRNGHSGIVDYFAHLGQYDELWVLPVYKHMYAEKREAMAEPGAPTFEDRVEMCRLSFEKYSTDSCKVKVLTTEQEVFAEALEAHREAGKDTTMPPRSSSYDVLLFLQKRHPAAQFFFLLGTDTYQDVLRGKWRNSEKLVRITRFVVINRLGVANDNSKGGLLDGVDVHYLPTLTDMSSTKIRTASVEELVLDPLVIDPAVWGYMRKKRLYGFNRQSWLKRVVDATVPRRTTMRSLIVAGTAGLLVALGLGAALITTGQKREKAPPQQR